jgi:hypothetical protein
VHISAGEVKLVTVLMHSNQLMWAGLMDLGPSLVQPNNGGLAPAEKAVCLKFCDFPACIVLHRFV